MELRVDQLTQRLKKPSHAAEIPRYRVRLFASKRSKVANEASTGTIKKHMNIGATKIKSMFEIQAEVIGLFQEFLNKSL
jgi:hypothetical protein